MGLKEVELEINELISKKLSLDSDSEAYDEINKQINQLINDNYTNLSSWDKVYLARHPDRTKAVDYINALFDNFYEIHGDRCFKDDQAIICGIASFNQIPVTVIAQNKGKNTQENLERNFAMASPEGYRKVMRVAKQAEKFNRPIIMFVDTPGAYPGKGAEERGQASAIANCLQLFASLQVPLISIVISEGGSGGALALSVCDYMVMLENAIYSILSPEGFASILYKDGSKAKEASEVMKLTAQDLKDLKVVDEIIKEPLQGVQNDPDYVFYQIKNILNEQLIKLKNIKVNKLINNRYERYRKVGS